MAGRFSRITSKTRKTLEVLAEDSDDDEKSLRTGTTPFKFGSSNRDGTTLSSWVKNIAYDKKKKCVFRKGIFHFSDFGLEFLKLNFVRQCILIHNVSILKKNHVVL